MSTWPASDSTWLKSGLTAASRVRSLLRPTLPVSPKSVSRSSRFSRPPGGRSSVAVGHGRQELDHPLEVQAGDGDGLGLGDDAALVGEDRRRAGHFRSPDELAEEAQPHGDRLAGRESGCSGGGCGIRRRSPGRRWRPCCTRRSPDRSETLPSDVHDAVALDAQGIDQEAVAALHGVVGVDDDADEVVREHGVPLAERGLDLGRVRSRSSGRRNRGCPRRRGNSLPVFWLGSLP